MNLKSKFKRILSGVLSLAVTASILPCFPAFADEQTEPEKYPYTMFAASDSEGAITINANNFCVNGNIATNGTIISNGNMNVNGTRTENADEEMIHILKKLNYSYFSGSNVEVYVDDYSFEDVNININNPMDVYGSLELTGNINLNSSIKAYEDVNINGEVKNANEAVICSETGDIIIETTNVNFNGLIYAPYGDIIIDTDNLNLNNVVIIGQTITLDCPNINANYSRNTAQLVGIGSDIDIELYAFGDYNSEANSIDIEWYTNYAKSGYEIWISDDNENYNSVSAVSGITTYQYLITEDFEKRYFKISLTTNYGEYIESIPFVVTKAEEGYYVDFLDSDDDGLPDVFEIMLDTDVNNPDTDDDGLTDYQEVYITGTDPTKYDSVTEGVSDADADSDGDGLSNAQEIELGTDPQLSDTDDDNLSDYDEIYVYGTDPLKPDTDDDGLDDDSELKFELDPNNPETHGIPDGEIQFSQSIFSDNKILSSINTENSPFVLSIDIKTNGDAEKEISISQSAYSSAIENDAMIGASLDFSISDTCNPEEIVLKYNIKEAYIDNTLNLYSSLEEFQGIKRLNIFKFYEDTNMLLPIDTEFDVENGLLYAEVDEFGTYCIMDMEIWLNNLGVEMPEEIQQEENIMYSNSPSILSASEDSGSVWKPTYVNVPIDLVFILQSAGTSSSDFDAEKQLIIDFASSVIKDYSNVKITVIEFKKDKANLLTDFLGRKYFTNIPLLFAALNNIEYSYESYYCDRGQAFKILLNDISLNYERDIYVYELTNGYTNSYTSYDNENVISKVKNNEVRAYSEIRPYNCHYRDPSVHERISKAITSNKDLFITLNSNTLSAMKTHFPTKLSPARPVYDIIVPTKWKKISLNGELNPDNNIDTDGDTLTDWEEVDTDRLIWKEDGSFEIPKFDAAVIVNHLKRFQGSDYNFLSNDLANILPRHYLPILSDPTMLNSDGDALEDSKDYEPLYHDPNPISYSNILSVEFKYIPLQEVKSLGGYLARKLSKKWDCNVFISIVKSCDFDEDIFCIYTEDMELSEVYLITSDLIKKLNNAEEEYQNSTYHVRNENAAHAGKLETDQLVPKYFEDGSSFYYGCWYHNYCHELKLLKYYSDAIDTASKAFLVYTAVLGMYQSKILASEQKAIQLSQEEYIESAKLTSNNGNTTLKDWVNNTDGLAQQAPIKIPSDAMVKSQVKNGYDQITFKWTENGLKYEARWHTKTPGAPETQGNTWVVSRVTPGTPDGQLRVEHILIESEWIPRYEWQNAISAYQSGSATAEQLKLLESGHWKSP